MQVNMTDNEKEFFLNTCSKHMRLLEYGSGESTFLAKQVCEVTSIETDPRWAEKTGAIHVNMGEVGSWGYPTKPITVQQLQIYLSYARDSVYDLLLIDGRFRVAVALYARPCEFLIHDYNRSEYHVIEQFATLIDRVENLALFKKTDEPAGNFLSPL